VYLIIYKIALGIWFVNKTPLLTQLIGMTVRIFNMLVAAANIAHNNIVGHSQIIS
jgi:hypothetical protein